MADPAIVEITPADAWQKVATAVQSGQVKIIGGGPDRFLHTYKSTGGAAPTGTDVGIGFNPSGLEKIESYVPIDVYIMAIGSTGKVLVAV